MRSARGRGCITICSVVSKIKKWGQQMTAYESNDVITPQQAGNPVWAVPGARQTHTGQGGLSLFRCAARRVGLTDLESDARASGTLAGRIGEGRLGERRPRGADAAQLPAMGDIRPGGDVAGVGHRAALHRGPCGQHRLHRQRLPVESSAVRDGRAMAGAERGARTDGLRAALRVAGRCGNGDSRLVSASKYLPVSAALQAPVPCQIGELASIIYTSGNHRQAQRRDAQPQQHVEQHPRRAGYLCRARRRSDAVLPAAVAHLRAHGRLLPASDDGRDRGLRTLHSAAVGRPADHQARPS